MSNMIAEKDVEINFRESMNNKAQLDFLEHKSSVNKTILEVNKQLTEINKKLIELNRMIMKKNEETLQFNTENLTTNEKFLKGEFHPSKATEKDNKKRIDQNTKRCKKIVIFVPLYILRCYRYLRQSSDFGGSNHYFLMHPEIATLM